MHATQCPATASSSRLEHSRRRGLLSVEESVTRSRQLRSCRNGDLIHISESVSVALDEWMRAWQIEDDGLEYRKAAGTEKVWCRTLFDEEVMRHIATSTDWQPMGDAATGVWWSLRRSGSAFDQKRLPDSKEGIHRLLICALFGEDECLGRAAGDVAAIGKSDVATDVARAAWTDWCRRLLECLNIPDSAMIGGTDMQKAALPSTLLDAWSGTTAIAVPWCGQTLLLLLSDAARVARPSLPKPAGSTKRVDSGKPIPILDAVTGSTVRMTVELLPVEIELGMLADLRVGDVLRTPHLLSDQLSLKIVDGIEKDPVPVSAFLGRTGNSRAIELTPAQHSRSTQVHEETAR